MKPFRKTVAIVTAVLVLVTGISAFQLAEQPQAASAANPALFDPGHIIDDAIFFDGTAMATSEIQEFLNAKVPSCAGVCLKNYTQSTPTMAAAAGRCTAYTGVANESAASIIARVGAACGVSQKAILVLLQKEQGLVTATNPSAGKMNAATGYSCPDTAACDPAFSGFFYQVYYAARQYKYYALYPTSFNHQAGRVNNIRYNPNAACGTKSVYIQNAATAGLYNYTPYTPNDAAMANVNGTGDGCSSYGNRNFWRYYTDWFGSPIVGSSIVRTTANSSVYLTSGTTKYPITSLETLTALAPLGQVAYVPQAYLDSFTTSHAVGRVLRGENGSIYFFDAGIKLPFSTCDLVVDYGGDCTTAGYTQLTDGQLASFVTGPAMGPILGTTEGSRYAVVDGVKHEVLDSRSQVEAGYPASYNVLTENAVASLPYGAPVIRNSAYVYNRTSGAYSYVQGGKEYPVAGSAATLGIPTRTTGSLTTTSLNLIPDAGTQFTGAVTSPSDTNQRLITDSGIYSWTTGAGGYNPTGAVQMSDELIGSYPAAGAIAVGSLIKTASNASVYIVMDSNIKPIGSWAALLSLSVGSSYTTVSDRVLASAPIGTVALTASSLVRSPNNTSIYFINGITNRVPVSSFDMTNEAGITNFEVFSDGVIQGYPDTQRALGFGYICATQKFVAAGGYLRPIADSEVALWPIDFLQLDSFSCNQMKSLPALAGSFIRTPDGSLFQLVGGQKRPIASMARFAQLGGTTYLNVHPKLAALIPTGPVA